MLNIFITGAGFDLQRASSATRVGGGRPRRDTVKTHAPPPRNRPRSSHSEKALVGQVAAPFMTTRGTEVACCVLRHPRCRTPTHSTDTGRFTPSRSICSLWMCRDSHASPRSTLTSPGDLLKIHKKTARIAEARFYIKSGVGGRFVRRPPSKIYSLHGGEPQTGDQKNK